MSGFRWAQISDLGGNERLVRSVLSTRIATRLSKRRVLDVGLPLVHRESHAGLSPPRPDHRLSTRPAICCFGAEPARPSARSARRLAPQPNLTMKGRNPETVLRAVAEWHRRLGRERYRKVISWAPSGIPPYRFEEGEGHNLKVYSITELLSSRELEDEGQAMSHCVATYAGSCAAGHVSIWCLRSSMLTIVRRGFSPSKSGIPTGRSCRHARSSTRQRVRKNFRSSRGGPAPADRRRRNIWSGESPGTRKLCIRFVSNKSGAEI